MKQLLIVDGSLSDSSGNITEMVTGVLLLSYLLIISGVRQNLARNFAFVLRFVRKSVICAEIQQYFYNTVQQ